MNAVKKSELELLESDGVVALQGPVSAFVREAPPENRRDVRFSITPADYARVSDIIDRCNRFALARGLPVIDKFLATLDLFAAHSNDWPIDFQAMCDCAFTYDVIEFVGGIGVRLDRTTGKLPGSWRGKFHVKVV